jgi:hypothetical protein
MIQITAYSLLDGSSVWTDMCDTGRLCTIPFSTEVTWECYSSGESYMDIVFLGDHWMITGSDQGSSKISIDLLPILERVIAELQIGNTAVFLGSEKEFDDIMALRDLPNMIGVGNYILSITSGMNTSM